MVDSLVLGCNQLQIVDRAARAELRLDFPGE